MCLVYQIVELMVTNVPILQIHQAYTDGSIDVMEVRWLNLAKKLLFKPVIKLNWKLYV